MELTEPEEEDLANTDSVGTLTLGRGQRGHIYVEDCYSQAPGPAVFSRGSVQRGNRRPRSHGAKDAVCRPTGPL